MRAISFSSLRLQGFFADEDEHNSDAFVLAAHLLLAVNQAKGHKGLAFSLLLFIRCTDTTVAYGEAGGAACATRAAGASAVDRVAECLALRRC